ncbi:hypothetical protein CYMTET_48257, partial [Cymbomonas tetramitiformis]
MGVNYIPLLACIGLALITIANAKFAHNAEHVAGNVTWEDGNVNWKLAPGVFHGAWEVAHVLDPKWPEHRATGGGTLVKGRPALFVSEYCEWAYFDIPFSANQLLHHTLDELKTECGFGGLHNLSLHWQDRERARIQVQASRSGHVGRRKSALSPAVILYEDRVQAFQKARDSIAVPALGLSTCFAPAPSYWTAEKPGKAEAGWWALSVEQNLPDMPKNISDPKYDMTEEGARVERDWFNPYQATEVVTKPFFAFTFVTDPLQRLLDTYNYLRPMVLSAGDGQAPQICTYFSAHPVRSKCS